jgi:hypothetical protein
MKATACAVLVGIVFFSANARGEPDGFSAVKCGSDIPRALAGKKMSNEPVAALESRHKDLGLQDLGGTEITDELFLASWKICGDEYELLERKETVRDVLKAPAHSRKAPLFIGACKRLGNAVPGTVVAVLDDKPGADPLAAHAAWTIDEQKNQFVALAPDGLACPRDGIVTSDGGP